MCNTGMSQGRQKYVETYVECAIDDIPQWLARAELGHVTWEESRNELDVLSAYMAFEYEIVGVSLNTLRINPLTH